MNSNITPSLPSLLSAISTAQEDGDWADAPLRFSAEALTQRKFLEKCVMPSRPALISGGLTDVAVAQLWTADGLATRFGDKELMMNVTPSGEGDALVDLTEEPTVLSQLGTIFLKPEERIMTLKDAVAAMQRQGSADSSSSASQPQEIFYLSSQNDNIRAAFPELLADLPSKPFPSFNPFKSSTLDAANVWLGGESNYSSCHKDHYHNLLSVIQGEKLFLIAPPQAVLHLYERQYPVGRYCYKKDCTMSEEWELLEVLGVSSGGKGSSSQDSRGSIPTSGSAATAAAASSAASAPAEAHSQPDSSSWHIHLELECSDAAHADRQLTFPLPAFRARIAKLFAERGQAAVPLDGTGRCGVCACVGGKRGDSCCAPRRSSATVTARAAAAAAVAAAATSSSLPPLSKLSCCGLKQQPWISVDVRGTACHCQQERWALAKQAGVRLVRISAGETLYLPPLWYHAVSQSGRQPPSSSPPSSTSTAAESSGHGASMPLTLAVNWWYDMDYRSPLWGYYSMCRRLAPLYQQEHEILWHEKAVLEGKEGGAMERKLLVAGQAEGEKGAGKEGTAGKEEATAPTARCSAAATVIEGKKGQ